MARADAYRETAPLADGGMATLALGAAADGTPVVIKRMRVELAFDASYRALFADEARVGRLLDHPGIVRVLDDGEDEHGPFLVLEYVDGTDLAVVLEDAYAHARPLELACVLAIAIPLADALAAAHQATTDDGRPLDLVHRDVSPGNVLLSVDGDVKLADFGVARSAIKTEATVAGEMKGKFAYMAPEQTRGVDVDARSDLFALGIVLHEMLSGRRLFDGPCDADIVTAVRSCDAPTLVGPDVPPALAALVVELLHKDKGARPASASAVAARLREIATEQCLDQGLRRHVARLARAHPRPQREARVVDEGARRRTQRVVGGVTRRTAGRRRAPLVVAGITGLAALAVVVVAGPSRDGPRDGIVAIPLPPSPAATPLRVVARATPPAPDVVEDELESAPESGPVVDEGPRTLPPLLVKPERGPLAAPTVVTAKSTGPAPSPSTGGRAGPSPDKAPVDAAGAPATTSASAAGFGKLFLRTEPWATVKLDGVDTGQTTPLHGLVVPAGRHTIELTNPHYGITRTVDIDVPAGGAVKQSLRLDQ